mgnify:CR=1 FL=1
MIPYIPAGCDQQGRQRSGCREGTPPAQAAEAVKVASNPGAILSKDAEAAERVAKVLNGFGIWGRAADVAARAAIAAMQAGEENK